MPLWPIHGGLRGGRSEIDQSLVVGPGPCAAHICIWDMSNMLTKRAAEGIAECEHALALDRNLAERAFAISDMVRFFSVDAEETEAHIAEALRLSPRDTMAYRWMYLRGHSEVRISAVRSRRSRGFGGRSRPTEIFRTRIFAWPPPSRSLVDLTRRVPQSRSASRSTRPSPSPDVRAGGPSDDPTVWPGWSSFEGMRKAGVPEQ